MLFHVYHHVKLDPEVMARLNDVFSRLDLMEKRIMTVSAQVQAALDGIRQTKTLVKSVQDGLALNTKMLADQAAQIAALQAQLAAGATIGADDLAALAETNQDIVDVNTALQTAIPANVPTP